MKTILLSALILTFGLTSSKNEQPKPLNAMTSLTQFRYGKAALKYYNTDSVSQADLAGTWEIKNSYFTVNMSSKTSFELQGRKYELNEDGSGIMDNTAFGYDKLDIKWSVSEDGREFIEGDENFRVRLVGDSMEWLGKSSMDYLYFVLVRESAD
ncbi:MAG: hypothetical protein ACFHU9_15030 [Fluviicola sp.]